ncbi:protein of unknown function (plasmid) [Azospirillum baldaniorum]|uniref:Uncharacterized protein n=1 Tax=Azospirillum baldaniorum TaxID=1064539 RepID=A0A9P1NSD3_9PROT|nr:protein of unknown function [Azospirillum baldaniorum]
MASNLLKSFTGVWFWEKQLMGFPVIMKRQYNLVD